jgi:hypothetical protein
VENFFEPANLWPGGGPYPHLVLRLGHYPGFRSFAGQHYEYLAPYEDHLGIVPPEWSHATVKGAHHQVSDSQVEQLRASVGRELRGMPPFRCQAGPVRVGVTSVTAYMWPKDGMAELARRFRAAAASVPGISLRADDSDYFAHSTLAYGTAGCDTRKLNRALRAEPVPRADFTVTSAALVQERQDPAAGIYTWDLVEEYALTAAP